MPSVKKNIKVEEKEFLCKIGFRIGYFRKLSKLSQQQLSDKSGVSLNTLSHLESTTATGISLIYLYRLAISLEIEPKQLLDFD